MKTIEIWYFEVESGKIQWKWSLDETGLNGMQESFKISGRRSNISICKNDDAHGPEIIFKHCHNTAPKNSL